MWNTQTVTIGAYSFYVEWNTDELGDIDINHISVIPTESDISDMLEVHANHLYCDIIANIDTSDINDGFEE